MDVVIVVDLALIYSLLSLRSQVPHVLNNGIYTYLPSINEPRDMGGWYSGSCRAVGPEGLSEAQVARRKVNPRVMLLRICGPSKGIFF